MCKRYFEVSNENFEGSCMMNKLEIVWAFGLALG
jgi:hypothetical protein